VSSGRRLRDPVRRCLALTLLLSACSRSSPSPPVPSATASAPSVIASAPSAVAVARAAPAAPPTPSASATPVPVPGRGPWALHADKDPYALTVVDATHARFCDAHGSRDLDLATGTMSNGVRVCPPKEEPNGACGGLPIDVEVDTPGLGPVDRVFANSWGFHPDGRVHDCAADGATLAIVTPNSVELYDTNDGATKIVEKVNGGERVAIGHGWVMWADYRDMVRAVSARYATTVTPREAGASH